MFKKIITVTMVSGLMLMASVGVFADAPQDASSSDVPPQDMLYIRNSDMKWIWITRQATRWGAHM